MDAQIALLIIINLAGEEKCVYISNALTPIKLCGVPLLANCQGIEHGCQWPALKLVQPIKNGADLLRYGVLYRYSCDKRVVFSHSSYP